MKGYCAMNRCRSSVFSRILFPAIVLLLTGASPLQAKEEQWNVCSTPKTQYVLHIPASLIPSPASPATGCAFQTPDGEFSVEAVVQPDAGEQGQTLEGRMQKEKDLLAGTVKYKKKGDSWFILAGVTPDGTEYYRKLFSKGSEW